MFIDILIKFPQIDVDLVHKYTHETNIIDVY